MLVIALYIFRFSRKYYGKTEIQTNKNPTVIVFIQYF